MFRGRSMRGALSSFRYVQADLCCAHVYRLQCTSNIVLMVQIILQQGFTTNVVRGTDLTA